MSASPPDSVPPLGRRGLAALALTGASSAILLAGCRIDPPGAASTPAPHTLGQGAQADLEVVTSTVARIDVVLRKVTHLTPAVPALSAVLVPVHTAHRDLLAAALPDRPATPPPGRKQTTLTGLRRAEADLQRQLTESAGSVSSGELARVLGSAAAGVAQLVLVVNQWEDA